MALKVLMIPAGYKPIPAVLGGAVETIVDNFIRINEEEKKLDFTILSVSNEKAIELSSHYKHSKFVFFKGYEKIDRIYYWFIYKVFKKFFNIVFPDYLLKKKIIDYVVQEQNNYDWILIEAGEIDCFRFFSKKLDTTKIIYHSHGEVRNEKKLDNCLQYYIAVSDFIKKVWSETVSWSEDRSVTLINGINQAKFEYEMSDNERFSKRRELGFADNDIVLLYVGRIVPEKGVEQLLDAMKALPENYKLLIIGSANFGTKSATLYEKNVKKLVGELGSRIVFTGYIPNEEIAKYYMLANISVVPSLFNDPAPLVIIEAMSAGLPIITTGSGGIKEYCNAECAVFVERGDNFVINLSEAVLTVGNDRDRCDQMSKNSKLRATEFSDKKQYDSLVDILMDWERKK